MPQFGLSKSAENDEASAGLVLADGNDIPLASEVEAANCAGVNLIELLIDAAVTNIVPPRLFYDRAADSGPLRERLAECGIELVCPHRRGRVRTATQDGKELKRYRKRLKSERTIACCTTSAVLSPVTKSTPTFTMASHSSIVL